MKRPSSQPDSPRTHPGNAAPSARTPPGGTPLAAPPHRLRLANPAVISLLLFVLVAAVFLPSIHNGFISYDDGFYGLYGADDPHVQSGLSWDNLRWAFTTLQGGTWHPLTWLSMMSDCQLFGMKAGGHHLTSLLLHALSTVLLFLALQRMTGATGRSAFVASLFALHPLHVETVAWAADRKDVLAGLFWMLVLFAYARYAEPSKPAAEAPAARRRRESASHRAFWYGVALAAFVGGLMSKTTVVTLPIILLLLDWWPLRRLSLPMLRNSDSPTLQPPGIPLRRLLLEKLPFFAAALLSGLVTLRGQSALGAISPGLPLAHRVHTAVLAQVYYLAQTFWPAKLAVFYPYPQSFPAGPALAAGLALLAFSGFTLWAVRRQPWLAAGWLWYLVTLLPTAQLVQIGSQSRADRFTYLPLVGIFLMVAWGACYLTRRWRHQRRALAAGAVAVVCLCIGLTRQQLGYWKDSETLFRHALEVTRGNYLAYYNVARALNEQGQTAECMTELTAALRIAPNFALAHHLLGTVLLPQAGRREEARAHLLRALEVEPDLAPAHNNLGSLLASEGRLDEAIAHFQEALRLKPGYEEARDNLTQALAERAAKAKP